MSKTAHRDDIHIYVHTVNVNAPEKFIRISIILLKTNFKRTVSRDISYLFFFQLVLDPRDMPR
jgi:hypothetical protein